MSDDDTDEGETESSPLGETLSTAQPCEASAMGGGGAVEGEHRIGEGKVNSLVRSGAWVDTGEETGEGLVSLVCPLCCRRLIAPFLLGVAERTWTPGAQGD